MLHVLPFVVYSSFTLVTLLAVHVRVGGPPCFLLTRAD